MIQEVGTLEGVEYIRMINKSGIITFSTDKEEIGRYLEKRKPGVTCVTPAANLRCKPQR